jgi:UMF1 family MFS transporter
MRGADVTKQHSNARFFSLFSITDKGASWLGPAAIAIIADRTGDIRHGFWFLLLLLILPLPILLIRVDMVKGRKQGIAYGVEGLTVDPVSS